MEYFTKQSPINFTRRFRCQFY